jgi:arsenate reductase
LPSTERKKILFVCTHNSARSQMAEGFINTHHSEKYEAHSAGTEPTALNLYAVKAMAEIGIDISKHQAKHVNTYLAQEFDCVVTVCDHARETCPFFPGAKKYLHQGFEDPSAFKGTDAEKMIVFRKVRDEIKNWIESILLQEV